MTIGPQSASSSRVKRAVILLRADSRRIVYESASEKNRNVGSGEYLITCANGLGPTLTTEDVHEMIASGLLIKDSEHLFFRGPKL